MRNGRPGLLVLAVGLLGIVLAQRVGPLAAPPLYDGVVVVDPYRWLVPPAGEHGDPQSAKATLRLDGARSPLLAIATPEEPPQAQVFGTSGALVLPSGTSSIKVSITPILPLSLPADGHITGNVYRITVANQRGVPLTAPASAQVSVVIRGSDGTAGATIERYADGRWQPLKTSDSGFAATFLAVVTEFGDFALVAPGPGGPYPTATATGHSASSADTFSLASTSPVTVGAAGSVAPTVSPAPPASPPTNGGGSPPLGAVVGLLVLAAVGVGTAFRLRGRRRRTPYRGAHPKGR